MKLDKDAKDKLSRMIAYSTITLCSIGSSFNAIGSIAELTRNNAKVQAPTTQQATTTQQEEKSASKEPEKPREVVAQETTRPDLIEIKRKQALADEEAKKQRAIADSITLPKIAQPIDYNNKSVVPQEVSQATANEINKYIMSSTSMLNNAKVAGLDSNSNLKLTMLHGSIIAVISDKLSMGGRPSSNSLASYNKAIGCVNGSNNQALTSSALKLIQMHNSVSGGALNDMPVRLGGNHTAQCM